MEHKTGFSISHIEGKYNLIFHWVDNSFIIHRLKTLKETFENIIFMGKEIMLDIYTDID